MTDSAPDNVKISCRNVWQLFGAGVKRFLKNHDYRPTFEQITEAGIIGGVRDVSLDVHEGEILMIMGLSGSGKSTMLRCITQLLKPTSGEVFFDGTDLTKISGRALSKIRRHKMGMVFQHFGLLPHRTVLENISYPLEIQNIDKETRIAKARELIDIVGLTGRESYYTPRVVRRTASNASVLAGVCRWEPDVWFLDEPFSALDPLIRKEMQDEFMRLQTQLHKSIVFVTHDFEEAVRLGDRIAIMKDGLLIQIGTPEELVTEPADGYVMAFVENAPKAKLISVGKIMKPGQGGDIGLEPVKSNAVLEDVAERIMLSEEAVPVTNKQGEIVGSIDKTTIVKVLFEA